MQQTRSNGRSPDRRRPRFDRILVALALVPLLALLGGVETALAEGPSGEDGGEAPTEQRDGSDDGTSAEDDEHQPSERDVEPPNDDKATPSAQTLLEQASEIVDKVASIRGLQPTDTVEKGVKTRDELRDILVEKLAEEQSKEQMRQEAAVFRKLGLIPEDFEYRKVILDVLTEQIAGFYDQTTGALNIMVGIPLDLQRPAMAHEIFHAIQDQHFDLTKMLEPFSSREHGDFQLARSALVEGDATVLMIDFSLYEKNTLPKNNVRSIVDIPMMANMLKKLDYNQLGALESLEAQGGKKKAAPKSGDEKAAGSPADLFDSALSDAPSIIRRVLIFPYLAGMRFVIALRSGRSWEEFNDVYDEPPVSTEQILHPERYAEEDEPVILSYEVDDVLPKFDRIYDTVLGEFQMRLFLKHHLDDETSEDGIGPRTAARGWDGDRLLAFRRGKDERPLLVHLSVWDSRRDAREYYDALQTVARSRFPDASARTASGKYGQSVCYRSTRDERPERIYLEQWGDAVLHIEGAPTSLNEEGDETNPKTYQVREQVWKSLDRKPFREVYEERMAEQENKDGEQ